MKKRYFKHAYITYNTWIVISIPERNPLVVLKDKTVAGALQSTLHEILVGNYIEISREEAIKLLGFDKLEIEI